jgi:hypothetical protein
MSPATRKITSMKRHIASISFCAALALCAASQSNAQGLLGSTGNFITLPEIVTASTTSTAGDLNPYGVAFVPFGFPNGGTVTPGNILVSNYNNSQNMQGLGGSIVSITPTGQTTTIFQGAGLGLTGALGILRSGYILVGSVPTTDGTQNTVTSGGLLILDKNGSLVNTLNLPGGPWGLAVLDFGYQAKVFISNVLTGTVIRLDMTGATVTNTTQIASGYMHRLDPAAIVVGPAGLTFDVEMDTLFVVSTGDEAVYAVSNAATTTTDNGVGNLIYSDNVHLHGPLDIVMTQNRHLIVANADAANVDPNQPSELVEFTMQGQFLRQLSVDHNNGGAFGLALVSQRSGNLLAAVDDNAATLTIWTLPSAQTFGFPRF